MYKTLGGLKNHMVVRSQAVFTFVGNGLMHHKCKHVVISDKDFEEKMCDIIENTKKGDFSCYPDDIKSAIINYHHHSTPLFFADT